MCILHVRVSMFPLSTIFDWFLELDSVIFYVVHFNVNLNRHTITKNLNRHTITKNLNRLTVTQNLNRHTVTKKLKSSHYHKNLKSSH